MKLKFEVQIQREADGSFRVVEIEGLRHYIIAVYSDEQIISTKLCPATIHPDEIVKAMEEIAVFHQSFNKEEIKRAEMFLKKAGINQYNPH